MVVYPGDVYDTTDIDVWLIDQYFRQVGPSAGEAARKHAELTAGAELEPRTIRRSKWNAPWEIGHWQLKATGVDTSDIPTIELVEIPHKMPWGRKLKKAIIENFMEHARPK